MLCWLHCTGTTINENQFQRPAGVQKTMAHFFGSKFDGKSLARPTEPLPPEYAAELVDLPNLRTGTTEKMWVCKCKSCAACYTGPLFDNLKCDLDRVWIIGKQFPNTPAEWGTVAIVPTGTEGLGQGLGFKSDAA